MTVHQIVQSEARGAAGGIRLTARCGEMAYRKSMADRQPESMTVWHSEVTCTACLPDFRLEQARAEVARESTGLG